MNVGIGSAITSMGVKATLQVKRLMLSDFRNYNSLSISLERKAVIIVGENGSGKTNFLEAVSVLCPGRGLRGAKASEICRALPSGESLPWAVSARFDGNFGEFEIGTGLSQDRSSGDKRLWRLSGEPVRSASELAERISAVWITPQMDRLFQEGASGRRRFLDRLVLALSPAHAKSVSAFEHAMTQRNRILSGERWDQSWLSALESTMASHAIEIHRAREALVQKLNTSLANGLTGDFPAGRLRMICSFSDILGESETDDAAEASLRDTLQRNRSQDRRAGATTVGPHRSDVEFFHVLKNQVANLCSTGEQKALLISTVLAHARLIAENRGFAPILLLDEVFAHLDRRRRESLSRALAEIPAQIFMTGTDVEMFGGLNDDSMVFQAASSNLTRNELAP